MSAVLIPLWIFLTLGWVALNALRSFQVSMQLRRVAVMSFQARAAWEVLNERLTPADMAAISVRAQVAWDAAGMKPKAASMDFRPPEDQPGWSK